MIPNSAIGNGATRVLLAVLTEKRPTTTKRLGQSAGLSSTSTVHSHLVRLRRLNLITWAPGRVGTLRPTCRIVPLIGTVPVAEEWWG